MAASSNYQDLARATLPMHIADADVPTSVQSILETTFTEQFPDHFHTSVLASEPAAGAPPEPVEHRARLLVQDAEWPSQHTVGVDVEASVSRDGQRVWVQLRRVWIPHSARGTGFSGQLVGAMERTGAALRQRLGAQTATLVLHAGGERGDHSGPVVWMKRGFSMNLTRDTTDGWAEAVARDGRLTPEQHGSLAGLIAEETAAHTRGAELPMAAFAEGLEAGCREVDPTLYPRLKQLSARSGWPRGCRMTFFACCVHLGHLTYPAVRSVP